jgi:Protein of unknown function (DUF2934)
LRIIIFQLPTLCDTGRSQGKSINICILVEMGKKSETSKTAAKVLAVASNTEPVAPLSAPPAAKKPAKKTLKKTTPAKVAFTADDIALRAYFIAEKRQKQGLPGSPHMDWLEAERQLLAESRKKASAKGKQKS